MRITLGRLSTALTFLSVAMLTTITSASLIEDFDGGGNTAWALTNSGGGAPSIQNGGATGNFVRLANLNGSNNNSIAFDENPTASGPAPGGLVLAFDFRMSDDDANADAGGCCGSAADGMGIGIYETSVYGSTGGTNPADGGAVWERPTHPNAFAVGLDIFQNIDVVSLNYNGAQIAERDVQPFLDLNDNKLHRGVVSLVPSGSDALASMMILEDLHGPTSVHTIFSNELIAGMDLPNLPGYRLIAGGRTGGAFVDGDLDNIFLQAIPEPNSLTLLLMGGLALLGKRNRNR